MTGEVVWSQFRRLTSLNRQIPIVEPVRERVVEWKRGGGDSRGGNRQGNCPNDTTSTDGNGDGVDECNLDPDITALELTAHEKAALVAFLKALTDERLACESAPFDHPGLSVSNGHTIFDKDTDGRADDRLIFIQAIGKKGFNSCLTNSGNLFDQLPL